MARLTTVSSIEIEEPQDTMRDKTDYVFFWKHNEANGWAGQWYPSPFTTTIKINGKEQTTTFTSAEQWMMVQKALLFGDFEIAGQVLAIQGTGPGAMAQVKALGREVRGFEEAKWVAHRERIVLEGNLLKFGQNEELKKLLLETGTRRLAEASPRDRIWGIGFGEKRGWSERSSWGLGLALEETRRRLGR